VRECHQIVPADVVLHCRLQHICYCAPLIFRTTIYRDPHSFTEQKKVALKIFLFIIEHNFTKNYISHNEACVTVPLFPVTADDGTDVHVNASYFQAQGVRQLKLVSKFGIHSYYCRKSNFADVQSFSRKSWTRLLNRQPARTASIL
jgi:hypothetical protein